MEESAGFLVDTNVISEPLRPHPSAAVLGWFGEQSPADLYIASLTLGELLRGAWKLPESRRKEDLLDWLSGDLTHQFQGRILPFDEASATLWGEWMGASDRAGRPLPAADAQIASIAASRSLTMVTRNTRDFSRFPVTIVNPFAT